MSPVRTADEMRACVCEQLALVLSIPRESIRPESRILIDLGAESLDLLDLTFRLEETLRIKLDAKDFAAALDPGLSPTEFRERFTVEALSVYLLIRLEHANADS